MAGLLDVAFDPKIGLDISILPSAGTCEPRDDKNNYWRNRRGHPIYLVTILWAHYFCRVKRTVADVGCHCSPLVLKIPGFEKRFAIEPNKIVAPLWKGVDGATFINAPIEKVDVRKLIGAPTFDLLICHQVIEHLHDPAAFAEALSSRARRLIVSTTFETPAGLMEDHVQDPISLSKFESWFRRKAQCHFIHRGPRASKILALF